MKGLQQKGARGSFLTFLEIKWLIWLKLGDNGDMHKRVSKKGSIDPRIAYIIS